MARPINILTAVAARTQAKPGYHFDGAGLYLQVSPTGSRSWVFRYRIGDRQREMGLGALANVSLADARKAAGECRKALKDGTDPIDARSSFAGRRKPSDKKHERGCHSTNAPLLTSTLIATVGGTRRAARNGRAHSRHT
jgi:hypothetical protein